MNFLINTFFVYLKKHEMKGVEASIYAITIVLIFNFLAFFHFFTYLIEVDIFNFITTGILALIFGFMINKYLEKKYLTGGSFKDLQLGNWYCLFPPAYYLASIFLLIISLRYS